MTLFEYMSVAISLILALTFAEGLRGLQLAIQPGRRYGVHLAWLFVKLSNPVTLWWSAWGIRDIPEFWNFANYCGFLVLASLIYLQVLSLVSHTPHLIDDWRGHFLKQRRWFFGLNIILTILTIYMWSGITITAPAKPVPLIGYTFILILSVGGFVSDNPKLHTAIVSAVGGFTIFYFGVATFRPITF
jgi:hypothetical protein